MGATQLPREIAIFSGLPIVETPRAFRISASWAQALELPPQLRLRERTAARGPRTYLDTFDWRLHAAGLALIVDPERSRLVRLGSGETVVAAAALAAPVRADALPPELAEVARIIGVRALLEVGALEREAEIVEVANDDDKLVVRIVEERGDAAGEPLPGRVVVRPVRGYDAEADEVAVALSAAGLEPAPGDLLDDVVAAAGRHPEDYQNKPRVDLDPDEPAAGGLRRILAALLDVARRVEDGVVRDLDPEFLHDLRVAMRRARSLLTRMRGVLPAEPAAALAAELRWLGSETGALRDLDVYLERLGGYRAELPQAMQADIEPLHAYLDARREATLIALRAAIDSPRYAQMMDAWRRLAEGDALGTRGGQRLSVVAGTEIRRAHQRLVREGRAISSDSPPAALHELRKTAKKLRYLLESFQPILPADDLDRVVSALKRLQESLGLFQDLTVQAEKLAGFARAMLSEGYGGSDTLLAMGVLVGHLEERQRDARKEVGRRFRRFDRKAVRKRVRAMAGEPRA